MTNTTTKTQPATKLNNTALVAAFRAFLTARAKKEGVDVSGLQIDWASLESTWGDLTGVVFHGCSSEINERVAKCFEAFAHKHATAGSYNAQRAIRLCGERYYHEYTNGAKSWSTNPTAGRETVIKYGDGSEFVVKLVKPIVTGVSVALSYFPCAD